ncbi:hypothetical protein L6452_41802 [Arctium lappa]|uniref:Uncharacterized protein n=1 Tax=Arctium lappa TaxID=4217 RepID=A0ACB8XIA0_ARCLA|nr:hypothetical protein L6452_41802 [Arctium lappa]
MGIGILRAILGVIPASCSRKEAAKVEDGGGGINGVCNIGLGEVNGVLFPSLSPSFVADDGLFLSREMSFGSTPSIDVDQSLSNVFSLLNLSPAMYSGHRRWQIGCGGSSDHHPVSSPRVMNSDFGLNNPFTVDSSNHHHRLCNNVDAFFFFSWV